MAIGPAEKKQLRAIGHGLKPVVTLGSNGPTESVLAEVERALEDHELLKIAVKAGDRSLMRTWTTELCTASNAELIQAIGHVILIYRPARKPDPRLSNILRAQTRKP